MASASAQVGIDFGTTNSSVARRTAQSVELVRFADDATTSRSLLYLERDAAGIRSSSGQAGIARYLAAHEDGVAPGRLVQSLKSYLPVRSLTTTEVFGRPYLLEDLVARILIDLRETAERQFGEPVRRATVGRPVRFVGAETAEDEAFALQRLTAAFHRAGFEEIRFALEPLAAAAAYAGAIQTPQTLLIGDFGGGTSDFSLLRVGPAGESTVLGNAGLPFAGDAFDARIVRRLVSPALGSETWARGTQSVPAVPAWIYANLERWHTLSFLRTRNVLELLTAARKRAVEPPRIEALQTLIDEDLGYQLHQAVQRSKALLSVRQDAPFVFNAGSFAYLDPPLAGHVARAALEQWIVPETAQIAAAVDALVAGAGLRAEQVDRVFLTGGSSFVPAVRRIFDERFTGRIAGGGEFTAVAEGLARLPLD